MKWEQNVFVRKPAGIGENGKMSCCWLLPSKVPLEICILGKQKCLVTTGSGAVRKCWLSSLCAPLEAPEVTIKATRSLCLVPRVVCRLHNEQEKPQSLSQSSVFQQKPRWALSLELWCGCAWAASPNPHLLPWVHP